MLVLDEIHAVASAEPDKLALSFNGRAIGYAAFWRLIMTRRDDLRRAVKGGAGLVVLRVTSLLEGWTLSLAARSLGFHTVALRSDELLELFEGMDVAALVSVQGENWPAAPGFGKAGRIELPPLDLEAAADGALPDAPRGARAGGHVLLTSGTTGRPKKVLSRCGESAATTSILGNGMVIPWTTAIVCMFDLGLWTGAGCWMPLWVWSGHGAVAIRQGEAWHTALTWPGVTNAVATPQYLDRLLALPEESFAFNPNLALTVTAGSITPRMAAEARRRIAPVIVINLSSTEVGTWARVAVARDEDLLWYRIDHNREVEVVDDDDAPLPPFKLGRVRLRLGAGADRGYFGPEPPSARVFEGDWFYPGDLGELDGNGRICLHGRATDVVNIGGDKISVAPWERALSERLGCEGVCVLSGRWGDGVERLHVFVESRRKISKADLNAAAQAVLWGFEGAHLHKVDALPRTPLGKIQRTVLAQQLHDGAFGPDGGRLA